ncbi:hypothetical protein ACFZCG_23765 [Streptomyces tanashiensis]|uniref:hypothetical protein n=1 Tax=Streptomyces tanashiensis TaxID=67367 RepID=UPI0036EC7115
MAGTACYKPGLRSRLIHAIRGCRGLKGEPKGFGCRDFRDLLPRARSQLGGLIVLVWDSVRLHQPTRVVRAGLKQIRHRPDFVDSCLAGTGLIADG